VQVSGDLATYLYTLVSTTIVFSAFGFVLGRQADRLADLSSKDSLTRLWNRRYFQERLEAEFARSLRYEQPLSILLFDLDDLKQLNDHNGHRAGDLALRQVAAAIRGNARNSDVVARWGGDEFVLLAPNTGEEEALGLADRVRLSVSATRGDGPGTTVSVGVSTVGIRRMNNAEALVRVADSALYEAKEGGRNRVVAR
jgi:diguanylate cyclase (GGDEF)-like protein